MCAMRLRFSPCSIAPSKAASIGEFAAMVTAPVQKSLIIEAGFAFSGHTEYLAARTHAARPVMMLAAGAMRVALATTHLPLKQVSEALTSELWCEVLEVLDRDLKRWWHLPRPRIAVCGLNPHAGESGHLGDEELRIIEPALERMRARGLEVVGPAARRHGVRADAAGTLRRGARDVPRSGPAGASSTRASTAP